MGGTHDSPSLDDTVAPPRSRVAELSLLSRLRDRVKQLERELPVIRGSADVWKSKAEKSAAREHYLLGEVTQLGDQFKC